MEKQKLYLDTSIPSAYFDNSKPIRQLVTQKWFELETVNFDLFTSVITIQEIERIKNEIKKQNIKDLIVDYNIEILDLNEKSKLLAEEYIRKGAIPKTEPEDSLHIAIAVINQINYLASWNFKHIVNINPIRKIHEINIKNGLNIIEIGSLELFGGYKYGNL